MLMVEPVREGETEKIQIFSGENKWHKQLTQNGEWIRSTALRSFTKSLMTCFFFFFLFSGHMVSKVIAEKECAHVMPAEK